MVQFVELGERTSAKGHKLYTAAWLPGSGAAADAAMLKAVLCFHHGVAEHVGRYNDFFSRLADAGIAVYSGDAVGHGKSEGCRALVESYVEAVDEFQAFCDFAAVDVRSRYPAAAEGQQQEEQQQPPMFIGGHSLGGLIAPLTCLRDQRRWAGLLLCSPALDVQMGLVLKIQAALGNILAAVVPRARLVPAVNPKDMNPDPQCVQEYMNDPLNTVGNLPTRTGNEALKGMRFLRQHWPNFTLPIYVHHGADDKCTSPAGSEAFFSAVSSHDKVLHMIPGGYHEVMLSPGVKDQIAAEMTAWILQHASGASSGSGAAADAAPGAAAAAAAKM